MTFHDYDENEPVTAINLTKNKEEDVRKRNDSSDTICEEFGSPKQATSTSENSSGNGFSKPSSGSADFVTIKRYFQQLSPRVKALATLLVLLVVSTTLHVWDAPSTDGIDIGYVHRKKEAKGGTSNRDKPGNAAFLPPVEMEPIPDGETCPDICYKRNTQRQEKYGGDLLNPQDVLRLAKEAKEKSIAALKVDYGTYFEDIFMKSSSSFHGMTGVTEDGLSRDRLKRKLKLKVLNMMQTIRALEENVAGCNCLAINDQKGKQPQGEKKAPVPPEFYGKYVFANGGHSQAAGHGNMFNETYTAYFEKDLKDIMGAIGIKFEGRNYAMGAMRAFPFISVCSKEIFGIDVDFLSWNFGMTDKWHDTSAFYAYRGALSPGRPALVYMDGVRNANLEGRAFEQEGLAVFKTDIFSVPTVTKGEDNKLPDSAPGGIPLKDEELDKLPPYLKALYCNGNLQGKPLCDSQKWSCTMRDIEKGKQCDCPNVGKRSGWHMGYKMHALQGRFLSLPFMEIFIEGLEEIAQSDKDTQVLREELQAAEDQEFESFKARPVFDAVAFNDSKLAPIYNNTELFETFFKGDSVCRTSLVPSQTRYLGISTNSDKVGGPQPGWAETYDVGVPLHINKGVYTYDEGHEPIPGIVQQSAKIDLRLDSPEWRKSCTQVTMPDYKDWLFGPLKDGKTTMIFPNEKERAYYGYDSSKFKGFLGLVPTLFGESAGKGVKSDIPMAMYETNVRLTVNGKKVGKFHLVNSMVILEDESGSLKWEPNENNEYVFEFEPFGEIDGKPVAEKHLRLYGPVVY